MSGTPEQHRSRRARRKAAGACVQCEGVPLDGQLMCERCAGMARERRRRYDATDRARELKNTRARAASLAARRGAPTRGELAQARDRAVMDWAECEGVVPTVNAIPGIIHDAGLGSVSHVAATKIRRRAFNLRSLERDPATGKWPVIPFPVPVEFLADG